MSNLVPLRAHAHDGTCGGTNEGDALLRKAVGELGVLAREAANELGLHFGPSCSGAYLGKSNVIQGVEVIQDGWERSNYFVELRRWTRERL